MASSPNRRSGSALSSGDDLEFMTVPSGQDDGAMNSANYSNRNNGGDYGAGYDANMGSNDSYLAYFSGSKHPMAALFHILFKSVALFFYLFGSWFTDSFIFTFVFCTVLLAFDFWTVKNVSGRLLVGLRWWSYVKPDGVNEWIFESLEDMAEVSNFDSRIFWGALYVTPLLWLALLGLGILRLKFEYMPIVLAAIAMSTANIVGYMKCSRDADAKMKNMVASGMASGAGLLGKVGLGSSSTLGWVYSGLLNVGGGNDSTGGGNNNNNNSMDKA